MRRSWSPNVLSVLGATGPLPAGRLAERADIVRRRPPRSGSLEESACLLPTSTGWVDGLRIADGVAFTHELSELELEAGALAADDDLALWASLAEDGLPLCTGGEVYLREGERYLRRVHHPVAETLLATLRPLLAAPTGTVGRNQPCPCGSGRKYKVCCLTGASHPRDRRAGLLYALLASFAQRSPSREFLGMLIARSGPDPTNTLLNLDLVVTHGGAAQRFLRARRAWLRADELALIESWTRTPIGVFEAVRIQPGVGVEVRELPDGEPVFLRDKLFSTSVRRLDLMCGRLLSNGSRPEILAIPAYVSRDRRREIVDVFAADPSAGQIAEFFGPRPDPYVQNSDGHDYFDAEVTLDVPDPAATWRRLADAFVVIDEDIVEHHVVVDSRTVSLGRVTREGRRLTVWANSLERLAAMEERVRTLAPQAREIARRAQRLGGEPPGRTGKPVQRLVFDACLLPTGPGVTAEQAFDDMLRERSMLWLTMSSPYGWGRWQPSVGAVHIELGTTSSRPKSPGSGTRSRPMMPA
jgi:SEC-C motif